jgi:uncharacterized ferritin-like protein (DUF455 family)
LIGSAACDVLLTAEAAAKARLSLEVAARWRAGDLALGFPMAPPDRPARPDRPELAAPNKMPKRRRAGSLAGRIALLHALAHIELNAIDLAWDLLVRFGEGQPTDFIDDWVRVAAEEASHFLLLAERLASLGAAYGDLPAHDGLWESAQATAGDLLARLAVAPLVLEARGLDVSPQTAERLRRAGDPDSAAVVDRIYADEIGHVAIGLKWFKRCSENRPESVETMFQEYVRRHFRGELKPPFNESARNSAGLTPNFYLPLANP